MLTIDGSLCRPGGEQGLDGGGVGKLRVDGGGLDAGERSNFFIWFTWRPDFSETRLFRSCYRLYHSCTSSSTPQVLLVALVGQPGDAGQWLALLAGHSVR